MMIRSQGAIMLTRRDLARFGLPAFAGRMGKASELLAES